MIAYHYDVNVILFKAIKNRRAATLTAAWISLNNRLKKAGVEPKSYIMDNECSEELKTAHFNERTPKGWVSNSRSRLSYS